MPRTRAFVEKAAGFTLIEILVAVVLLAVGALGAVTMQRTAVKSNQATFANEVATSLARQVLEATKNLDYDDTRLNATGNSWTAVPSSLSMNALGNAPAHFTRLWQIIDNGAVDPANEVRKQIRVQVTWNQAGQSRAVVLSTIKAND